MLDDTISPAPPAQLREFQFDSFVDQEGGLDGWDQLYRQLSPGAFRGRISALSLNGITLYRETVNQQMENIYKVPEGHVCIGFALDNRAALAGRQAALASGFGLIQTPDEDYHMFTETDADFVMLTIPQARVPQMAATRTRPVPQDEGRQTARWLITLIESARKGLAPRGLLELAPEMLIDRISLWTEAECRPNQSGRGSRAMMNDILAACDALPPDQLTVSHLARLLDRDRASLRAACLEHSGLRLDDLLKGRRLSEVHRRLRQADPRSTRISDVSMEFGYLHWGRFAQVYRTMFGERPSDTLHRPPSPARAAC